MALNLKTLGVRSLTATVFVAVLLGGILAGYTTFCILFLIISIGGLFEFFRMTRKVAAFPYEIAGYSMAVVINACFIFRHTFNSPDVHNQILLILIVIPFVIMANGLFS